MEHQEHKVITYLKEALYSAPQGSRATIYCDDYTLADLPGIINDLYAEFKNPDIQIKDRVLRISGELKDDYIPTN